MLVTRTPTGSVGTVVADPATMPLVHVVDDEPAIQNLFQRLGPIGGFTVHVHPTGADLLRTIEEDRPGCLVIDLVLPDMTGIELLEELARRHCKLPVVFMSGLARASEAVKAIKLGSLDFLEKPFDMQEMLATVKHAIGVDTHRRQSGVDRGEMERNFATLTPRENEVMELIVQGAANKEVAARLGLSPKTVEVHRANVMRKTRAGSLAELVRMHITLRG